MTPDTFSLIQAYNDRLEPCTKEYKLLALFQALLRVFGYDTWVNGQYIDDSHCHVMLNGL